MPYRAYRYDENGWSLIGEFPERKSAVKAMKKSGAVLYDCGNRLFLSSNSPYTMPRATVEELRELPGNEDMTI